jgi:hypothetical protein
MAQLPKRWRAEQGMVVQPQQSIPAAEAPVENAARADSEGQEEDVSEERSSTYLAVSCWAQRVGIAYYDAGTGEASVN